MELCLFCAYALSINSLNRFFKDAVCGLGYFMRAQPATALDVMRLTFANPVIRVPSLSSSNWLTKIYTAPIKHAPFSNPRAFLTNRMVRVPSPPFIEVFTQYLVYHIEPIVRTDTTSFGPLLYISLSRHLTTSPATVWFLPSVLLSARLSWSLVPSLGLAYVVPYRLRKECYGCISRIFSVLFGSSCLGVIWRLTT